jgi:hypothetical protein
MAAQAHAAHEIRFNDCHPVLIRYVLKGLWIIPMMNSDELIAYEINDQRRLL